MKLTNLFLLLCIFAFHSAHGFGYFPCTKKGRQTKLACDSQLISDFAQSPALLTDGQRKYKQFKQAIVRVKKQKQQQQETQIALDATLSYIAENKHLNPREKYEEISWLTQHGAGVTYTQRYNLLSPLYRFLMSCYWTDNSQNRECNEKTAQLLLNPHVLGYQYKDGIKHTCLDQAIRARMFGTIQLLVGAKADANQIDGFLPQHRIFNSDYTDEDAVTVLNILAPAGYDVENAQKFHEKSAASLVHLARTIQKGKPKLTAALLVHGASPECSCGCEVTDSEDARNAHKKWKVGAQKEIAQHLPKSKENSTDVTDIVIDYCFGEKWQYPNKYITFKKFTESQQDPNLGVEDYTAQL